MDANTERLILKGLKDYKSLTPSELETFKRLRQESLIELYETLPDEISSSLNMYLDTVKEGDSGFYEGFLAAMEWYRDLIKAGSSPTFLAGVDMFHIPLYVTATKRSATESNSKRAYLERLLEK